MANDAKVTQNAVLNQRAGHEFVRRFADGISLDSFEG
jgi:hypothetical protein